MHPRLVQEWDELLAIHPDVKHAEEPERMQLSLELAPHTYTLDSTRAAVLIPVGYPTTPLDGFLVPHGLALAGGESLPLTGDGAPLGMPGWQLVSFHLVDEQGRSTWRPTADPARGDNLVSYISSIEAFLARRCS
jgi:hypothetical protein